MRTIGTKQTHGVLLPDVTKSFYPQLILIL